MEAQEIIERVKRYTQQQKKVAKEMDISPITLNLVLSGADKPGRLVLMKMSLWLEKQERNERDI